MCEFEGCTREAKCRNWCMGHYTQWYRGNPLTPLRTYQRLDASEGKKVCTNCHVEKNNDEFYKFKSGTLYSRCKVCFRKNVNDRHKANKAAAAVGN